MAVYSQAQYCGSGRTNWAGISFPPRWALQQSLLIQTHYSRLLFILLHFPAGRLESQVSRLLLQALDYEPTDLIKTPPTRYIAAYCFTFSDTEMLHK